VLYSLNGYSLNDFFAPLRPLFARASIPLQLSMFALEMGASTRDTALLRILHTAQSVRHEGGVPAPDDEL
jgi:hypothetical protein